VKIVGVM